MCYQERMKGNPCFSLVRPIIGLISTNAVATALSSFWKTSRKKQEQQHYIVLLHSSHDRLQRHTKTVWFSKLSKELETFESCFSIWHTNKKKPAILPSCLKLPCRLFIYRNFPGSHIFEENFCRYIVWPLSLLKITVCIPGNCPGS